MKIIVSPSKTQKIRSRNIQSENEKLLFDKKTKILLNRLKSFSLKEIENIMKINSKLAESVYDMYKKYDKAKQGEAIFSYTGMVYKGLEIDKYNDKEYDYINNHIRILSAFYGVLTPFTKIKPYRLDMKMNILINESLYKFWKEEINNYFEKEDELINLASKEFSNIIKREMINVEFLTNEKGKLRQVATHSKMARGRLLNHIVLEKVSKIEQLKQMKVDNYKYNEELSTENKLVFVRN